MNKYLFFLGIHPEISTAELKAVFSAENIEYKVESANKKYLILSTDKNIDAEQLINRLGGIIKIAKHTPIKNSTPSIVNFLMEAQPTGKVLFSITGAGKKQALSIKKSLKENGRGARYIEIKNTASILHNSLVKKQGDISVIDNEIFATCAIQPIEELSKRDFGRPSADSFSGMLPPKLARIMINLSGATFDESIMDAFCGSGTVLTEAIAMGYKKIYGSDISKKAVEDSKKNTDWIISEKEIEGVEKKIFLSDASKLDAQIDNTSIKAIVSEPYMGKPLHGNETEKYLQKQASELSRLYTDAFVSFHKILKQDGIIIFIIPSFKFNQDWIQIECVDKIKKIGFYVEPFSKKSTFLRYNRPGQHLARDIWKFRKK